MGRRIISITALLLLALVFAFAETIDTPSASFQIRWHVENLSDDMCQLKILNYTSQEEVEDESEFSLAYTTVWQGLCIFQYRTNMIKKTIDENTVLLQHTLKLIFTPLIPQVDDDPPPSVGYDVKVLVGHNSSFYFDSTAESWEYEEELNDGQTTSLSVLSSDLSRSTSDISFVAQHPTDKERNIITMLIPVQVKLTELSDVRSGIKYRAQISVEVTSP